MEFFLRKVYPWLVDTAIISIVIPLLAGLFLIGKNKSIQFRLLFLYIVVTALTEGLGYLVVFLGTKNNIWTIHVYTVLEFIILGAIYYHSFSRPFIKKGIVIAAILLVVFSIINAAMIEGINQMNSGAKMLGNSMLIALAVLYFYKVANNLTIRYLDRDPVFLLSCGLLIYKAGTSMSYALFNQALAQSYDAARICIAVMVVLNILFYMFLVFVLRKAIV